MCIQHYTKVMYDCGHQEVHKDDLEECGSENCHKVGQRMEIDLLSGKCPDCVKNGY